MSFNWKIHPGELFQVKINIQVKKGLPGEKKTYIKNITLKHTQTRFELLCFLQILMNR